MMYRKSDMRLLICTQVVDSEDQNLGFFHEWIEEFAKRVESVEVMCLREGKHQLPPNVHVHSLGKEDGPSRWKYVTRFLMYMWTLRRSYDAVFVHMNPEYVLLGGWFWRLWRKPIVLWYMHKTVDTKLRIAALFVKNIATVGRESCRLKSKKVILFGHGIPVEKFAQEPRTTSPIIRILTAGRFTRAKRVKEMIAVMDVLYLRMVPFRFTVLGGPYTPQDMEYEQEVRRMVDERPYKSSISFAGPVPHRELPHHLAEADVFLNFSLTGSVDKAVLEPMAAGVVPITSNEAFAGIVLPASYLKEFSAEAAADAIIRYREVDVETHKSYVRNHHSLHVLIDQLCAMMSP
jgi:glycosyltransferase involved in cell wall biosynthesis